MKAGKRLIMKLCIIIIILSGLPKKVNAQIDPGGDPDAPIDGGVSLLVAAGVGYGIKKIRGTKQASIDIDSSQTDQI
jgi:hypothetical protein